MRKTCGTKMAPGTAKVGTLRTTMKNPMKGRVLRGTKRGGGGR